MEYMSLKVGIPLQSTKHTNSISLLSTVHRDNYRHQQHYHISTK